MKRILSGALCAMMILLILTLSACGATKPVTSSFQAMDTLMTLTVYGGDDTCEKLEERIKALDSALDATAPDSEIYRLNSEKSAAVGDVTADLLHLALGYCEDLDGAFDITVYPAVLAWGFTTGEYRVPDKKELDALAENIDYRSVASDGKTFTLPDAVMLDLGAVAKGYAADVSRELLSQSDAKAAVLNLGGTICLCGKKPDGSRFKVGVADPENPAGYFGYLSCGEGVTATSGGYERYFERDGKRYIHILNPKTAAPVENGLKSVTIFTDSGAYADALSTALFVMGLNQATAYYRENGGFDFIILTDDNKLYITEGICDDFTLADGYDFEVEKIGR